MSKAADALRAISGGVDMGKATSTPSIPNVPRTDNAGLKQFLSSVKQILETREGSRGDSLDATVTWRELLEKQFAKVDGDQVSQNIVPAWIDALGSFGSDSLAMTIPPSPTGLTADGAFANVILSWDDPPYSNHSYTEIWRSGENNLGTAQLVGMAAGSVYTDNVGGSTSYYYWIKFVSTSGIKGPFNQTEGTNGETSPDPSILLDLLAGQLNESQLNVDLSTKIELAGNAAADIIEINTITEDSGSAAARAIAQVQARLDTGDYAAVKTESAATADAVEGVQAKYSVKVDVNGYVSGFGIISSANNSTPFSQFIFKADQFGFGAPGLDSAYPFVIQATATTINGVAVPAGVYIDAAYIVNGSITSAKIGNAAIDSAKIADAAISTAKIADASITSAKIENAAITNAKIGNAAITTAKIDDLAVNTLKIAGNAVTVSSSFQGYGDTQVGTSATTVLSGTITVSGNQPVYVMVTAFAGGAYFGSSSGDADVSGYVVIGGTSQTIVPNLTVKSFNLTCASGAALFTGLSAGTYSITLNFVTNLGTGHFIRQPRIIVIETKR